MSNLKSKSPHKFTDKSNSAESRRSFIKKTAAAAFTLASTDLLDVTANGSDSNKIFMTKDPWYQTVTRWGQTNITEKDPAHYDITWWRKHWKRNEHREL